MNLYVISGVTGMTGNELVRQILARNDDSRILGFDNFFASYIDTVSDCINNSRFEFHELDLTNKNDMKKIEDSVKDLSCKNKNFNEIIYINCAAVVHTELKVIVNLILKEEFYQQKKLKNVQIGVPK